MTNNNADFNNLLKHVNKCLADCLTAYPYNTKDILPVAKYAVQAPGHRWRPILFLKIYGMLSGRNYVQPVLPIACSMEFLHTASIILDDLPSMDNALLRRGKKTSHLVFGEARTVIAALWLCDVAQHLIHNTRLQNEERGFRLDLENKLRQTKSSLIAGQLLDLRQKQKTISKIIRMYELKSGVFYAFAASTPARLLGMRHIIKPLEKFGHYLGIAYQLADDIADLTANEKSLGKDIHKDDGKFTIPQKFGIRRAIELRDIYRDKAVAQLKRLPQPIDDLVDLTDRIIRG